MYKVESFMELCVLALGRVENKKAYDQFESQESIS